ncbi:DUF4178 domain-containing protein [Ideonella livida]|uniref:DUF4178 domain-containing protein n=1 Tax=Ideonella livida TaxID=2707176 RepID=A0A7C9PK29_9BURK|nr:DUF4178 domain-containing protein [Ideonella livida]NDY93171.1 DUF4178 domain-containing protein [Ideonella livida]
MASPPPGPPPSPETPPAPRAQRVWRAACPHCGAPVEFSSAASASAVCSFCRSTLLREGQALRQIGTSAELFDDHSPLQLGVRGQWQGVGFVLVGRLQYGYGEGTWNEWFALFERPDGHEKPAWLSEDNGAYVLAFDQPLPAPWPSPETLQPGLRRQVGTQMWSVASSQRVRVLAAQGELPRPPQLNRDFMLADLRNEASEVGTLSFERLDAPQWSIGRSVQLTELRLSGLREDVAEKTLRGQGLNCPSCGAALTPNLASTRSLSCGQCKAVVDISQGVGADLAHYAQQQADAGGEPLLPLGRSAVLSLGTPKPAAWQVVGYLERCELPGPDDEEQDFWREYLLYNRQLGFAFLVDTEDGWSWMRPLTGAPQYKGATVTWQARRYQQRWAYRARTTWVQGEFYWRVSQGETASVTDFQGPGGWQLSREQAGGEVVWSEGQALEANTLARAFRLDEAQRARMHRDAAPLSGLVRRLGPQPTQLDAFKDGVRLVAWAVFIVLVLIVLLATCSRDECDDTRRAFGEASAEYRQCLERQRSSSRSGGSSGSFSSGGGGHK